MAIYKLGNICKIETGKVYSTEYIKNNFGKYPIISSATTKNGIIGYINTYKYDGEYITITTRGANAGTIFFQKNKFTTTHLSYLIINNEKIVKNKYLYFYLKKNEQNNKLKYVKGSTIPLLNLQDVNNFEIKIPPLDEQNKIIEIIKPLENIVNKITKLLVKLENLGKRLSVLTIKEGKFIDNISLLKGQKLKKDGLLKKETRVPFINISALNNNINTYVDEENVPNVNYGDVLVSMDGTPGIVTNFIHGHNGYAYKCQSDTVSNSRIYYSLKHKKNQNIIKNNSFGTNILHASRSIPYLILFDFKYDNYLEQCFLMEIKLKKLVKVAQEILYLKIKTLINN
ncbi:restriction endonuclease subunit S [Candidatus Mycoplasma pogonae]